MDLLELQNITAYFKNSPIIEPKQVDKERIKCNKMDEEWIKTIRRNRQFWFTEYQFRFEDFLPHQLPYVPKVLSLRDRLLTFGGEQACMPVIDRDVDDILTRGQFWYGDILKMKKGEPCQCHYNSANLWDRNRENVKIVTGYALTVDGMWRQHTWCLQVKPRKNIILETTEERICYFGYVLTDTEAEKFFNSNI